MSNIPGNPKVPGNLAAIFAADTAGNSALMGAADVATVRALKAHQAAILALVGEHGGCIIDTAGDGILAEFASVVECALAIHKTMAGIDPRHDAPSNAPDPIGDRPCGVVCCEGLGAGVDIAV